MAAVCVLDSEEDEGSSEMALLVGSRRSGYWLKRSTLLAILSDLARGFCLETGCCCGVERRFGLERVSGTRTGGFGELTIYFPSGNGRKQWIYLELHNEVGSEGWRTEYAMRRKPRPQAVLKSGRRWQNKYLLETCVSLASDHNSTDLNIQI